MPAHDSTLFQKFTEACERERLMPSDENRRAKEEALAAYQAQCDRDAR